MSKFGFFQLLWCGAKGQSDAAVCLGGHCECGVASEAMLTKRAELSKLWKAHRNASPVSQVIEYVQLWVSVVLLMLTLAAQCRQQLARNAFGQT